MRSRSGELALTHTRERASIAFYPSSATRRPPPTRISSSPTASLPPGWPPHGSRGGPRAAARRRCPARQAAAKKWTRRRRAAMPPTCEGLTGCRRAADVRRSGGPTGGPVQPRAEPPRWTACERTARHFVALRAVGWSWTHPPVVKRHAARSPWLCDAGVRPQSSAVGAASRGGRDVVGAAGLANRVGRQRRRRRPQGGCRRAVLFVCGHRRWTHRANTELRLTARASSSRVRGVPRDLCTCIRM